LKLLIVTLFGQAVDFILLGFKSLSDRLPEKVADE
jgi:hypothetical protein